MMVLLMSVKRLQPRLIFELAILWVLLYDDLLLVVGSVRLAGLELGLCKSQIQDFRSQCTRMFNITDVLWL